MSEHWPDDILAVVGLRVEGSDRELIIRGSVHKACVRCESLIWISPATLQSVRAVKHGFLCMECARFLAAQDGEDTTVVPPSDLQIEEIRENLPPPGPEEP
jgi:hypothetical protein